MPLLFNKDRMSGHLQQSKIEKLHHFIHTYNIGPQLPLETLRNLLKLPPYV